MRRIPSAWVVGGLGFGAVVGGRLHYLARPQDVPNPYASTHLTIALSSLAVGTWVTTRRPRHPVGWTLLLAGLCAACTYVGQPAVVELMLAGAPPWLSRTVFVALSWQWLAARSLLLIGAPSVVPDGWPQRSRRWVLVAGAAVTLALCGAHAALNQGRPGGDGEPPQNGVYPLAASVARWALRGQWLLGVLAVAGLVVTALATDRARRRRTRLFVLGAVLLAATGLGQLAADVWPGVAWPGDGWERWTSGLLPVALGAAVVFDHLLDVHLVVRRLVFFTGLTALGTFAFAVVAALVGAMTDVGGSGQQALAAGGAATALVPVFGTWRDWVDQRVYGDTARPDRLLARLGAKFATARGSHETIAALAAEVADTLKLPWVAVEVTPEGSAPVVAASVGTRVGSFESFPIVFAGAELGRLVVGSRTPGEPLRSREREVMADLARHAGVVVHDAYLEAQLRSSREQIVQAREEERRRLRHDLHDGLGPTLASVALGLEAAAVRVDDVALAELLVDINGEVRDAIDDIRRLVDGLRPPALDDLGLVRALQQHTRAVSERSGLEVRLSAHDIPPLPAAVEVAAYRVITEALSNVHRHARARSCDVNVSTVAGTLYVEVVDDGIGLGPAPAAGVGLQSMKDRAEELLGRFSIVSSASGTALNAAFPIGQGGTG